MINLSQSDKVTILIKELLAACRQDPILFCEKILGFTPHPQQKIWLQNSWYDENLLVTGNRFGKSWIAAAKQIFKAVTQYGWDKKTAQAFAARGESYLAANVSVTQDQANLVWGKARGMLSSSKASWLVDDVRYSPYPTIKFINGAELTARATARKGEHLLGHAYNSVNWDEAAYEPDFLYIRDNVLRMRMVDRKGTMDYTTTGNGKNDFGQFFQRVLDKKEDNKYAQTGSSFANPYIPKDRLAQMIKDLPDRLKRQNLYGEITEMGGDFFDPEDIDACTSEKLTENMRIIAFDEEDLPAYVLVFHDKTHETAWWRFYPSHFYVHGWDLARKQDWVVGVTYDVTTKPASLVEFERYRRKSWKHTVNRIEDRYKRYGGKVYYDATGVGDVVGEMLDVNMGATPIVFTKPQKEGMLENWNRMINLRQVSWPSINVMIEEHKFYRLDDEQLKTDTVMANILAGWAMYEMHGIIKPAAYNYMR